MSLKNGRISQVIGPVVDVWFDTEVQKSEDDLPKIYAA